MTDDITPAAGLANIDQLVARVIAELVREGVSLTPDATRPHAATATDGELVIDLPDPTLEAARRTIGIAEPYDPDGLRNLCATTTARLGVGRTGARPRTASLLLFQADHAVTQDAIYGVVDDATKDALGLFTVTTQVADREEYLLRPDLGRRLSEHGKATIAERCVKRPDVQICVGDGLSAAAISNNLADIYPVIEQGLTAAGLSLGTPFFIENARVGVMNDVNAIIGAKVVVLLIGERPGLGIADAMSAYMGYDPQPGKSDADRDLICMITTHGGTNPLEAGAYVVEFVKKMIQHSASGVRLRDVAGAE
ncbi:ethanolamine ammonia-lyase subunit EutC [Xylanimonas allomyrinae]|uniref:Ethanolamine ammonia-lyase small subunit n=1 Tax=Xylanimonas allomyrinae TaxID=2509459 RepID=A0A4P6EL15_9MICO|nr:ethanolamine ammonia-lyase subunit EutC [Xylanimonas allomyrinae]QAY63314.1 ethanolamine ammonia-lyase subunit EutC [Xylanimonas allomyrinae]